MEETNEEAEKELSELVDWYETYHRVCFAMDDDEAPKSWDEVKATELAGWNIATMSVKAWDAYMRQRLIRTVEGYLFAVGRHPFHQAAYDRAKSPPHPIKDTTK